MEYIINILIYIVIYSIFAISLNFITGYSGLLSLGQSAFFGIGGYASALFSLYLGIKFPISLLFAGLFASLAGLIISLPAIKLKGDYFALATLGFAEIVRVFALNLKNITRGPMGLPGIPRSTFLGISFDSSIVYFMFSIFIFICTIFIIKLLRFSPYGLNLMAIRDDEDAAMSLGHNPQYYKTTALFVSGFFAGLAGGLYAHYTYFIDPTSISINESVLVLCMIVLGGVGSFSGPIVGAIIIVFITELLRFMGLPPGLIGSFQRLLFGLILIILMLFKPQGIFGRTFGRGNYYR